MGKNSPDSAGGPVGSLEKGSIAPESTGNFLSILEKKKMLSVRSSSAQTLITPGKRWKEVILREAFEAAAAAANAGQRQKKNHPTHTTRSD